MATKSTKVGRGGSRRGAGRKKGAKSRVNEAMKAAILADPDVKPINFLLGIMRAPLPVYEPGEDWKLYIWRLNRWRDDAIDAAKACLPHTSPKLESVTYKGDKDNPVEVNNNHTVRFVTPP